MKFKISVIPFLSFIFFLLLIYQTKLNAQLKVSDVADKVLKQNPDLQRNRKKISEANGLRIQAISTFNTSYNAGLNKILNYSNYTYASPTKGNQINSWNYSLGASRKLAIGTTITPSLLVNNTGLFESFPYIGNSTLVNHGAATLRVSQPLLLGLGAKYNTAALRTAEYSLSAIENQYIFQASSILSQTFKSYIQYIGAYQSLLIQLQTEATITKSIADINRLIEQDAMPAAEMAILQAQLYNQKATRKLAQNKLTATRNALGANMGLEESDITNLALPDTIFPINDAGFQNDTMFVTNWLSKATSNRGDYLALDKNIKSAELDAFVSKKNIKPKLDLNLSAGYNGIAQGKGGDQYLSPLLQNIPGMNYSIGFAFVFAGKNDLARGQQLKSNSTLDILKDQQKALVLDIRNQVKLSGNNFINFMRVVGFLTESVKNYKKAYQNEVLKFQAGTTTSFALVQVQNNYLLAKNQLISVLTDLNSAIIEFRHQTGTLIEAQSNNTFNLDLSQMFTIPVVK